MTEEKNYIAPPPEADGDYKYYLVAGDMPVRVKLDENKHECLAEMPNDGMPGQMKVNNSMLSMIFKEEYADEITKEDFIGFCEGYATYCKRMALSNTPRVEDSACFQNRELNFDELYAKAVESTPLLSQFGDNVLDDLRTKFPGKFEDARFETANLKDKGKAEAKLRRDYDGKLWRAVNLCCGWIVVNTAEEVGLAIEYIKKYAEALNLVRIRNRFETPANDLYRDVLTNVKLKNGHVAEFRIEYTKMMSARKLTSLPHEIAQDLESNNLGKELTPEKKKIVVKIRDDIRCTHWRAVK